jgi:hypothetical protein
METSPALPERTRLFHIGPPKTGTMALQEAAAARRAELLRHGVRYPGSGIVHGMAVAAFLGQRWGWQGAGSQVPPRSRWVDLMAEVHADRRNRVLLGHEYAAKADEATIARFAAEIGDPLHVVITLRPFAAMLPSTWQETLKLGAVRGLGPWLRQVLERPGPTGVDHPARNQGLLVRRWASVVGADRVTVVALDRTRPELLFTAFEGMLGLPSGLLAGGASAQTGNRGLTMPEAEYLRRINGVLREDGIRWDDWFDYVSGAAIGRVIRDRVPPADEPRPGLPGWAAERANALAARFVDEIRGSGVRVLGDLDSLAAPVPGRVQPAPATVVPMDVAVTSVRAAIGTATRREPAAADGAIDGREYLVVRHVGIGGLLLVIASRLRRRGRKAVRVAPAAAARAVRRQAEKRRRHAAGDASAGAAAR